MPVRKAPRRQAKSEITAVTLPPVKTTTEKDKPKKPKETKKNVKKPAPNANVSTQGLPPLSNASTEVEVTSTGEKIPTSLSPGTVTVVGGDQIQSQPGGRIGEALITVPGLYLSGSADDSNFPGGASGQINLNGVSGPNRTIILIDGIPFNPPTGTSVDYSQLPTFGVDRIEVLPGPYSALYGSQALGGVINIITKEPTKEEFQGEVSAGRSAYGSDIDKVNLAYRNVTSYGLGYTIDFGYSGSTGFHDTPATVSANPFYTGPAPH